MPKSKKNWAITSTMNRALFLDRDGVINIDHGYTHIWSDELLVFGVCDLIRRFLDQEYKIIVVTNQSGIGRGIYDETTFVKFMSDMRLCLNRNDVDIDDYYFCPCMPSLPMCQFRKPNPGMILKAISDHDIAPERSALLGDKATDILAADAANVANRYLFASSGTLEEKKLKGIDYKLVSSLYDVR